MAAPHTPDHAPDPVRQALLDVRHEVAKAVVGQDATVTGHADRPAVARACAARGRAGRGQDAAGPRPVRCAEPGHQARAVHPGPDARRRHRVPGLRRRTPPSSASAKARSSPTSCWPTRSTGRRPRPRPRCWKPWRNARSPWTACRARCRSRSSWRPRRTRWSTRAPTRCPRPSWTASCSS